MKRQRPDATLNLRRVAALSAIALTATGCQTFRMSDEKFAREQVGHYETTTASRATELLGVPLQVFGPWLACH